MSVLRHTYSNWECIVVNDGSTDNTAEVAQTFCDFDKKGLFIIFKKIKACPKREIQGFSSLMEDFY